MFENDVPFPPAPAGRRQAEQEIRKRQECHDTGRVIA